MYTIAQTDYYTSISPPPPLIDVSVQSVPMNFVHNHFFLFSPSLLLQPSFSNFFNQQTRYLADSSAPYHRRRQSNRSALQRAQVAIRFHVFSFCFPSEVRLFATFPPFTTMLDTCSMVFLMFRYYNSMYYAFRRRGVDQHQFTLA